MHEPGGTSCDRTGTPHDQFDYQALWVARHHSSRGSQGLKRSKHEKAIIAATNKANKDSNEQAKKDLVAFYGLPNDAHVSSADFEKMWLYREQFGQDPYTGKGINLERMLNDRDYVENRTTSSRSRVSAMTRNPIRSCALRKATAIRRTARRMNG